MESSRSYIKNGVDRFVFCVFKKNTKLEDTYRVDKPKIFYYRVKVTGINENEYNDSDEDLIKKKFYKMI